MAKVTAVALTEQEKFYQRVIDYSVEPTILHLSNEILYINDSAAKFFRSEKEAIIGSAVLNTFPKEAEPFVKIRVAKVMAENVPAELIEQEVLRPDGTMIVVQLSCYPIIYGGRVVVQTVFRDITKLKGITKANEQLIKDINAISSPIVPILEGISVLPLVGAIDKHRADQLLESIPIKIQVSNLQYLIIDLSGIYAFDSVIVGYLLKFHNVIKLLGVQTIVTGVRPDLARALVELNEEFLSLKTASTVMQALRSLGVKN